MEMESELIPLVPEKTYAVCTNGLKKGEMVVTSHDLYTMEDGRLIATLNDKPTNFACVYTGILVALIGGAIVALCCTGIGATIGGLILATLVGIIASYGLKGLVCRFCLKNAMWLPNTLHPRLEIQGQKALTAKSTIVCNPPLCSSGNIQLFYSAETADRVANIYRWNNYSRIFNSALTGWAIPSLIYGSLGTLCSKGILKGTLSILKMGGRAYVGGVSLNVFQKFVGKFFGNKWTPVEEKTRNNADLLNNDKYDDVYDNSNDYNIAPGENWDQFFVGEDGSNLWGVLTKAKMTNMDKSIVMKFANKMTKTPFLKLSRSKAMKTSWNLNSARPQNMKRGVALLGFSVAVSCLFEIYTSHLENEYKNELPKFMTDEEKAMAESKIFEG